MGRSCVGLEASVAQLWIAVVRSIRGVGPLEVTRNAKHALRMTLEEIAYGEHELNEELARHVLKLKTMRASSANQERPDVSRLKPLLLQCRKIRMKIQTLSKKRLALENHMDTLDNSELNQHVLHSMQKTSHALKGMGLDKALESVDRVMMDLEENHGDVTSIQNSLAISFDNSEEFDWEAEMAMLLEPDTYFGEAAQVNTQVHAPLTVNAVAACDNPTSALDVHVITDDVPEVMSDVIGVQEQVT
jgi:hypothetical protein